MAKIKSTSVTQTKRGWTLNVVYDNGKRSTIRKKNWTKQDAVAKELELQMLDEADKFSQTRVPASKLKDLGFVPDAPTDDTYTLLDAFNHAMEYQWKPSGGGYRTNVIYAKEVVSWFGANTPVAHVYPRQVIQYRKYCEEKRGNEPSTINAKVSKLSVMREMALVHGGVNNLPSFPKSLKLKNHKDDFWPDKEILAIEEYLRRRNRKDCARMFVFLCEMGCRPIEMERQTKKDYDLQNKTVEFFKEIDDNKSVNRVLPLTPIAYKCVVEQILNVKGVQVWPVTCDALRAQVQKAMDVLDIDRPAPIKLTRHTCGTRLGRNGLNSLEIANWLGHASEAMCKRYVHMDRQAHANAYNILANRGISDLVNAPNS